MAPCPKIQTLKAFSEWILSQVLLRSYPALSHVYGVTVLPYIAVSFCFFENLHTLFEYVIHQYGHEGDS